MEWLEKAVFYSVDAAVDAAECRGEVIYYYSVHRITMLLTAVMLLSEVLMLFVSLLTAA